MDVFFCVKVQNYIFAIVHNVGCGRGGGGRSESCVWTRVSSK